ncbi:hypothetical protein FXE80_00685 [Vibrio cholerae]|uniref:hypothetical protein n=1 Tax=Vibrio cholerae TaxID=666 RepID=UPI0011DBBDCA|nr:hypothetical protein [Vibrio cholerae]TXY77901.1 hypothetical protein FXE80_00685 [Vibrio cholerae]GIB16409.1 hypothetical protein VCSRO90_2716 [Vibrio cholerae]
MNQAFNRLNHSISRGFNPDSFVANLLNIESKYISGKMNSMSGMCGILDSEIFAFGYIKIKQTKNQSLMAIIERSIERLLNVPFFAQSKVDEDKYLGSEVLFYEFYLLAISKEMNDYSPKFLDILKKCISEDEGNQLDRRFLSALLAMKFSNYNSQRCEFINDEMLKSVFIYSLRKNIGNVSSFQFNNLIDSALDLNIHLASLTVKDGVLLRDIVPFYFNQESVDKFSASCQRQDSLNVIKQNEEKIDFSFNSDMYFDF